jgi:hypothetical protein
MKPILKTTLISYKFNLNDEQDVKAYADFVRAMDGRRCFNIIADTKDKSALEEALCEFPFDYDILDKKKY